MKKKLLLSIATIASFLFCTENLSAQAAPTNPPADGEYRSAGPVNFTSATNWQIANNGGFIPATTPPDGTKTITIQNGNALTVNAAIAVTGYIKNFNGTATQSSTTTSGSTSVTLSAANAGISVGQTVTGTGIPAATTVTAVSGTAITLSAAATVSGTATLTFTGSAITFSSGSLAFNSGSTYEQAAEAGSIPISTWNTGSTCLVTGAIAAQPANANQNFYNFTWNCPSQTTSVNLGWSANTISGNLSVLSSGTQSLRMTNSAANGTNDVTINILGDVNVSGTASKLTVTGSGGARVYIINHSGNINASSTGGGYFSLSDGTAGTTIWNFSGISFNASNTLLKGGGPASCKFIFSKPGVQNLSYIGTITYSGIFNYEVANGSSLNIGSTVVSSANSAILVRPGATIITSSPTGVTGNFNTPNRWFQDGSDYVLNGTTAQTLSFPNARAFVTAGNTTSASNIITLLTANSDVALGQDITGTNIPVGTRVFGVSGTTITLSQAATATGANINFTFSPGSTSTQNVNNITIANSAGVTLSSTIRLGNTFNFGNINNSTFSVGSTGNLQLYSTAISTARIADITNSGVNSGNAISGRISVEQYLPVNTTNGRTGRAWRLVASPLAASSAPTIFSAWQEGGVATATGTHITQAGGAGTNGYDASTIANASSIRSWNGTNLVTPANTNVTKVTDNGAGYFLFVRGNRELDINSAAASSATTLRMFGAVNTGNITMGVSGSTYSLIPNPYPSPVDYEAIITGNPSLTGTYYVYDANLGTVGGYRTIQRTAANTYQSTPSTGSGTSDNLMRYIISGQSIFLPGAATVNFTETMKSAIVPTTSVFRTGNAEELTVDLKLATAGNASLLADGVRVKFDNTYSNAIDASDIIKNANFTENLAIAKGGATLSIEKRDLVDHADTIFLKLWNTAVKDYEFEITPSAFNAPNLSAYLEDAFTGTSTPLSLTHATQVQFSVTTAATSQNADRFKIVFRTNGVLAVNYTSVKAYQQNAGVQVEWNIASETNIRNYEVEKSTDGRTFAKATTVTARANNNTSVSYNWYDATPVNGVNYYRIKATENSNAVKVSQVVSVKIGGGKSEITVYPNPVSGNTMSLQFTNEANGTYTVELFNSIGQQVYAKTIEHQGGSATQTLNLGSTVSKGVYQLQVTNGENKTTQQVVIN